jgi:hypothetical protein
MKTATEEMKNSQQDLLPIPFIINFDKGYGVDDFIQWYGANESLIDTRLLKNGAVLFRGVDISTLERFNKIANAAAPEFFSYVDGFSPRIKLSSNVYTSTEYDADFYITLHNELSYSARWPSKIFFCCLVPPGAGGETPIADCRRIMREMRPELIEEFESKGVKYIRNLHGGLGLGPSWQDTFETQDKTVVEEFCKKAGTDYHWKPDGGLKLTHVKPAFINHPITGERVWFNQVDQFHPCHMDKDIFDTLMLMHGGDEEELPMFGSFGDGSKISVDMIGEIRRTVDSVAILTPWQKGDLLLVDNVLVCHGRMPFKGDRKILVSMF